MSRIDPSVLRRQVAFPSPYRPGTIVVMIGERHLYFVEPGGRAMRYTVGVGREEALNFRGNAVIGRKAEWPHWTPTADMIRRMPIYAHYTAGLPGGVNNPPTSGTITVQFSQLQTLGTAGLTTVGADASAFLLYRCAPGVVPSDGALATTSNRTVSAKAGTPASWSVLVVLKARVIRNRNGRPWELNLPPACVW